MLIVPALIELITAKDHQATAVFHKRLQLVQLTALQLADIGQHHHARVAYGRGVEIGHVDDARLQQIHQIRLTALAVGLQGNLQKIRFALKRFRIRRAIDHQHGHLVPDRNAGPENIIGLEAIGICGHLNDMRARRIEGMSEAHLPAFAGTEWNLLFIHRLAVGMKDDPQGLVIAFAVIAQRRLHGDRLIDAQQQVRGGHRFHADIFPAFHAHVKECEVRRHLKPLQLLAHPCAQRRRAFLRGPADPLKIADEHHLTVRVVHVQQLLGAMLQCGAHLRLPKTRLHSLKLLGYRLGVKHRGIVQRRFGITHEHHVYIRTPLQFLHQFRGGVAGLLEVRAAGALEIQRVTIVQHHQQRGLCVGPQGRRALENWPRHAERQQDGNGTTQQHEQPMLKPQPALLGFECELNQVHSTPFHLTMLALADEVYEDGNGCCRRAPHQC